MTAEKRFYKYVSPEPNTGCWLWLGCVSQYGYGIFWFNGSTTQAHRVAYELFVGAIPSGLELDHKCRVRSCVNPAHLESVTHKENLSRSPLIAANWDSCKYGHLLDANNTRYRIRKGYRIRVCRLCHNFHQKYYNSLERKLTLNERNDSTT